MTIKVTERAVVKIKDLLTTAGAKFFRVGLLAGGCSGLSYNFSFEDEISENDTQVSVAGVTILIGPKVSLHIAGSTLDWEESLLSKGFKFTNPKQTGSCSCGKSFSV